MQKELKRTILSTIVITIGVILAVIALVVVIDVHCVNDSYYWMPLYPDAELVETNQQGYFRVRGMGTTEQLYSSPTDVTTVRGWYRDYRREITSGEANNNPDAALSGFGINQYVVSEGENGGSIIRYYTQCGQ